MTGWPDALDELRPADLYDLWLLAAMESALALGEWRLAAWPDKRDAYAAYRAALDREQRAAAVLAARAAPEAWAACAA